MAEAETEVVLAVVLGPKQAHKMTVARNTPYSVQPPNSCGAASGAHGRRAVGAVYLRGQLEGGRKVLSARRGATLDGDVQCLQQFPNRIPLGLGAGTGSGCRPVTAAPEAVPAGSWITSQQVSFADESATPRNPLRAVHYRIEVLDSRGGTR